MFHDNAVGSRRFHAIRSSVIFRLLDSSFFTVRELTTLCTLDVRFDGDTQWGATASIECVCHCRPKNFTGRPWEPEPCVPGLVPFPIEFPLSPFALYRVYSICLEHRAHHSHHRKAEPYLERRADKELFDTWRSTVVPAE